MIESDLNFLSQKEVSPVTIHWNNRTASDKTDWIAKAFSAGEIDSIFFPTIKIEYEFKKNSPTPSVTQSAEKEFQRVDSSFQFFLGKYHRSSAINIDHSSANSIWVENDDVDRSGQPIQRSTKVASIGTLLFLLGIPEEKTLEVTSYFDKVKNKSLDSYGNAFAEKLLANALDKTVMGYQCKVDGLLSTRFLTSITHPGENTLKSPKTYRTYTEIREGRMFTVTESMH